MKSRSLWVGVIFTAVTSVAFASDRQITFRLATGISNQKVFVASKLTQWQAGSMALIESVPGDYSLTLPEPWLHQLVYKFIVDGQWLDDPANPNKIADGHGGTNSYYNLAFQDDPLLQPHPELPKWKTQWIMPTDSEGDHRRVYLSQPPEGFFPQKERVVVYFQDGKDYLDRTGILNLFANLSARDDMPVFYGVFVPPKDRDREYGLTPSSNGDVDFMTKTVVPGRRGL